jgi:WD40 repeat protein/S1-C subfamily serine protease
VSEQPSGLVRIVTGEATAGTGFLVSEDGLVATCAHVLARGDRFGVEFRFGPGAGQVREAAIDPDLIRPPDAEDVALLRLPGGVPPGVEPLPLGSSAAPNGASYSTFGFPSTKPLEGMAGRVEVTGRTSEGGFEVLQLRSNEVSRGFSGAPVWDAHGAVIGLVVSVTRADELGRQDEVAFIRPVEQLIELCPELRPVVAPPYRGLEVFEEEHAGDYFGREEDARKLVRLLSERSFVAIVGVSGSGKSSLARAGLRKGLEQFDVPGLERRPRCVVLPGSAPVLDLALALAGLPGVGSAAAARAFGLGQDDLADSGAPMREVADRLAAAPPERLAHALGELCPRGLILVVDQFERLFTEVRDEERRRHFLDLLLEAKSESVAVLITLRGEYYGHVLDEPGLDEALRDGQMTLLRMSGDELARAIVEPARRRGRRVQAGLPDRLIADVGRSPGNLPLLEFALTELWALDADSGVLKTDTYERELGYEGPDGPVPGVHGAIAKRAEEVWSTLGPGERDAARQALLAVVGPGPGGDSAAAATSRRAWLKELDEPARAVAGKFADARLLTTGQEPYRHEPTIEVAHEALFRAWPPLAGWAKEYGPFVRWRDEELTPLWQRWEARNRDPDLLLPPAMLDELREQEEVYARELSPAHREYIERSREAARDRTAERRAAVRQRRRLTAALVGVVIVTAVVGALAFSVSERARDRARAADARSLAEASQTNLASRPDLGALLAAEAWQIDEGSVEARDAALSAVQRTDLVEAALRAPNQSRVSALAFSPTPNVLAAGGFDRTIRLWDLARRRQTQPPVVGPGFEEPDGLAFNNAGDVLAAIYPTDGVLLWPVANRRTEPVALERSADSVSDLAFSPGGKRVAAAGYDGTVRLYAADTGEYSRSLGNRIDDVVGADVAFGGGGESVARVSAHGRFDEWSVPGGEHLGGRRFGGGSVWELALSPRLDSFVVVERSGVVRLWGARRGPGKRLLDTGEPAQAAAFSPNGSSVAVLHADGTVTLWDARTGQALGRPLQSPPDTVSLAFSPSGERLATGGDGLVTVWRVDGDGRLVRPLDRDPGARFGSGTAVAAGAEGSSVAWSDAADTYLRAGGRPPEKVPSPDLGPTLSDLGFSFIVADLEFGPGGQALALMSQMEGVALWRLGEDEPGVPIGGDQYREEIAFGPGGAIAMQESETGLRLRDVAGDGALGPTVTGDQTNMLALASDPQTGLIASAGYDRAIDLWRIAGEGAGRRLERDGEALRGHSSAVLAVAFGPEGDLLVSGGNDGTVRVWDVDAREQRGSALFAGGPVSAVAIDPDGGTIAAVGLDSGELRLWDLESRRDLGDPLPAHAGGAEDLVFAGDGRSLLTAGSFPRVRPGMDVTERGALLPSLAGADWTVAEWDSLLWSDDRDRVTRRLCTVASRNLTPGEWERFLPDRDHHDTCPRWPAGR